MAIAKGEYQIEIKVIDGDVKMKIDGLTKGFVKLETGMKKLRLASNQASESTEKLGNSSVDMMNKSGLAGATLVELGRTISDLPYGIRGIANNLSQLSTLFVTLISTAGGFKRAMVVLRNTLTKGPLGFILVFQAVIAALDHFSGSSKKAEEQTRDLTLSIKEQVIVNRELADALNEVNLTREEQQGIVREIAKTEKGLKDILKDVTLSEGERNKKIQKYLNLREKEEILNEKLKVSRKDLSEADIKLHEAEKQRDDNLQNLLNLLNSYEGVELTLADLRGKSIEQLKELHKERTNELYDYQQMANIGDLISDVSVAQDNYNDKLKIHIDLLKGANLLDIQRGRLMGKSKKDLKDTAEEFVKLTRGAVDVYSEFYRQSQKLNDNIAELSGQRRDIEIADINRVLAEDISALKERSLTREGFERGKIKLIQEALKKEIKAIQFALDNDRLTIKERIELRERLSNITIKLATTQVEEAIKAAKHLQRHFEFILGAFTASNDAQISIEEKRTVLANNQLKKRLRNEKLSAKQRESINNQIAANEEDLQKKRDKIAEKNFKLQKAVSIANTLISTAEMASDAFGTIKGMKILGPAALPLAIAAAATATAFGLKQVNAIRRTQFVPSALSAGGGSGGGGGAGGAGIEAPDFNVVGASSQNQLAETIAGAEAKPTRAYVVGKDITTQQELDRNITNTASFG